ncbi:MAG: AsmA family protein [Planctomycetota bacterium]
MTRTLRILGFTFLFVLVLVQALAHPAMVRTLLQEGLEKALPGKVRIVGASLGFPAELRIRNFTLAQEGIPLLRVEGLRLGFNPLAFLRGAVELTSIEADRAHVRLMRDLQGNPLWPKLGDRTEPATERSSEDSLPDVKAEASVRVRHVVFVMETRSHKIMTFRGGRVSSGLCEADLKHLALCVQARAPGASRGTLNIQINARKARIELDIPSIACGEELAVCLPREEAQFLRSLNLEGTASMHLVHDTHIPTGEEEGLLEFRPLPPFFACPQAFPLRVALHEGTVGYNKTLDGLDVSHVSFSHLTPSGVLAARGVFNARDGLQDIRLDTVTACPELNAALPPGIRRFVETMQPDAPFSVTIQSLGDAAKVEARLRGVNFKGLNPPINNVTARVSVDTPSFSSGHFLGFAEVGSAEILGIPFTRVTLPIIKDEALRIGSSESPLVAEGPMARVEGWMRVTDSLVKSDLRVSGLDLSQWSLLQTKDDAAVSLNGYVDGLLKIEAELGGLGQVGTFIWRLQDADVVAKSNFLPLARLLRTPADLLLRPKDFLDFKGRPLTEQHVFSGKGRVAIERDHLSATASLNGEPVNFDAKSRVEYSGKGEIELSPIPLTRYDPLGILFNILPIKIRWDAEKVDVK